MWQDLNRIHIKVTSSCIGLIKLLVFGSIYTHLHSCCTTDAIYSLDSTQYIQFKGLIHAEG
jgi:hypothetical protein